MPESRFTVRWFDAAALRVREDVVGGASAVQAEAALRGRIDDSGGTLLSVSRAPALSGAPARTGARLDVAWWCRELRTLVSAGMTVVEALETLNAQALGAARARVNARMVEALRQGRALSDAMQDTGAFPPVLIAGVKAAERTSGLVAALDDFLLYDGTMQALRRQVVSAAIYPSLVLGLGTLISGFLLLFVVPRFSAMYADLRGPTSLPTRMLVELAAVLQVHSSWLLAAIALVATGGVAAWRLQWPQRAAIDLAGRIGPLQRQIDHYRLAKLYQSVALMFRGGYPLDEALRLCIGLGLGERIGRGLQAAHLALAHGARVSTAMEQGGLTDLVSLRLLTVGERTGEFDRVLRTISERHSAQFLTFVERATRIVEPALLLVVALTVGAIVVMMYMPIFDIASSLG